MNREEFLTAVKELGISITDKQLEQLNEYYKALVEWNKKINLTSITEEKDVYLKHFYDSLTLFKEYDLTKDISLCDVGTGAGFPGVVLKIVFPNLKITLVDSLQKRLKFLDYVIKLLDLKDVELVHERMEDYSKQNEERFDIITSRAVAKTKILVEISFKALKISGHLILMKSSFEEELSDAEKIIRDIGGEVINVNSFKLPIENSQRALINIKKVRKTEVKYPRSIDKIKKIIEVLIK